MLIFQEEENENTTCLRIFQPRASPKNRLFGNANSFLFGSTTSGKAVNERTAMQTTAVYSCVRILAEAIAGLPLHVYRYKDDGGKEKDIHHPLYYLLHAEPTPEMTSFVFRETLIVIFYYGEMHMHKLSGVAPGGFWLFTPCCQTRWR